MIRDPDRARKELTAKTKKKLLELQKKGMDGTVRRSIGIATAKILCEHPADKLAWSMFTLKGTAYQSVRCTVCKQHTTIADR